MFKLKLLATLAVVLTAFFIAGSAIAGTTDIKTGAVLTYQIPLVNPDGPTDGNGDLTSEAYGRYPIGEILNLVTTSMISDFDAAVSANSAVAVNTEKNSYPDVDAAKLALIESGATSDMTDSEIQLALDGLLGTGWRVGDGYEANTDSQTLSINGNNLTIAGGNTVPLPTGGATASTELTDSADLVRQVEIGTAANNAETDFATNAQGVKADTALQPADMTSHAGSLDPHTGYLLESAAGTAAYLDHGVNVGDLVRYVDIGGGVAGLNIGEVVSLTGFTLLPSSLCSGATGADQSTCETNGGTWGASTNNQNLWTWLNANWPSGGATAEDAVYDVTWDGDTDAASKNSLYDKIETLSAGSAPTIQDANPTSASSTGFYGATTSGDFFYKDGNGLFNITTGVYTADPVTYTLSLTLVGLDGDSVNGVAVAGPTDINGLTSASYSLVESFGATNDTIVCGSPATGSANDYLVDMSASNQSVLCTFSVAGGPTASTVLSLDDNSAGTTVAVTGIGAASLSGAANTSDLHTTDKVEGTGSFALNAGDRINVTGVDECDDAICTIEFAIKGDQTGAADGYCRFVSDSAAIIRIRRENLDTALSLQYNSVSTTATTTDFDNLAWHYFRFVIDINGSNAGKTLIVYQGASPAGLSEVGSTTNAITAAGVGSSIYFMSDDTGRSWGNVAGGNLADHIQIWDSVVTP